LPQAQLFILPRVKIITGKYFSIFSSKSHASGGAEGNYSSKLFQASGERSLVI